MSWQRNIQEEVSCVTGTRCARLCMDLHYLCSYLARPEAQSQDMKVSNIYYTYRQVGEGMHAEQHDLEHSMNLLTSSDL